MQLTGLLHNTLKKQLPFIHKARLNTLFDAVNTLIKTNRLSLTALGRNLSKKNKTRSNIKKIDRLLGNVHLHNETFSFYQALASNLIKEGSCPWLHIDWSCISSVTNLYLLRASLSMQGRSIVIYEECHPKKNENNHLTHKAFLNKLKTILPLHTKPVIVTDAGFRGPWFAEVKKMGWDFVGRVRHKNLIKLDNSLKWKLSGNFYSQSKEKPCYLGSGLLTRKLQVSAHFVLYKSKKKKYQGKTREYAIERARYIASHKEPWLLATSLPLSEEIALKTVRIYKQRMRIEENFRDTKCTRYGFGLKESRSRSVMRMKILVLISALATFACWLAGIMTKKAKLASDYQAQSSKSKGVLSNVYLGREALKRGIKLTQKQFSNLILELFNQAREVQLESPTC